MNNLNYFTKEIFKNKATDHLTELIKSTHKSLRTQSQNKDDDEIKDLWMNHTKNTELLKEYSEAMHILATEYWDLRKDVSRIKWTYDSLKEYFFGGFIATKLEKEARRVSLLEPSSLENFQQKNRDVKRRYESLQKLRVLDVGSCYNPFGKYDDLEVTPIDLHPAKPEVYRCDFLCVKLNDGDDNPEDSPVNGQESHNTGTKEDGNMKLFSQGIKRQNLEAENDLLNELNCCGDGKILKYDLCGSKKKTKLNEGLEPGTEMSSNSYETIELNCCTENDPEWTHLATSKSDRFSANEHCCNDINELKKGSFDAVIFSFFLEYIPTAKLRYECCVKAYKLLKPSGILCIVTPDSKHLTGNILFFKLWKCTLALIGFERIKYEKCAHFHAMTFRKALVPSTLKDHAEKELISLNSKQFFTKYPNLNWHTVRNSLYIIQDMQTMKQENNNDK